MSRCHYILDGGRDAIDGERELDVLERSSDIGREQVERLLRRRCQAAHAQIPSDGDHRHARAADEVRQLVRQRVELAIAALKLLIDGGQLFVGRLQFLLGRLELFVRALQFLVARQHFLVGGAQFLAGRFLIVHDRLEILPGRHQFLSEPRRIAAGRRRRTVVVSEGIRRQRRPALRLEQHEQAALGVVWQPDREDAKREFDVVVAVDDMQPFSDDRTVRGPGLRQGAAQVHEETLLGQAQDVGGRLPAWGLEVRRRAPVEMLDLEVVIDQGARRPVASDHQAFRLALKVPARLTDDTGAVRRRAGRPVDVFRRATITRWKDSGSSCSSAPV